MSDEPVDDRDGLPARRVDWDVTPCFVQFQLRLDGDREIYALIIDTRDNRNVTWWTREELEAVLRNGLAFLGVIPDGIYLANESDLAGGGTGPWTIDD